MGIPEDYRKKPNVFRVILQSGLVMLFTADTSTSVRHWIETLRKVSGLDMDVVREILTAKGVWSGANLSFCEENRFCFASVLP